MKKGDHGDRKSEYGWEIDHIDEDPDNNDLDNLRPLFWGNNLERNEKKPRFYKYNPDTGENER